MTLLLLCLCIQKPFRGHQEKVREKVGEKARSNFIQDGRVKERIQTLAQEFKESQFVIWDSPLLSL